MKQHEGDRRNPLGFPQFAGVIGGGGVSQRFDLF
jgi:hypothetical protein